MESATAKRPRGRPRTNAPPRPSIHVRLSPPLKARLEEDAEKANRSVRKEIEIRLENSYRDEDEIYGGPELAALFRELAKIAVGVVLQKNRGSFFDDFEAFVSTTNVWDSVIKDRMPAPDDELLAEVSRTWDAVKAGAPQTPAQRAASEWLIQHTQRSNLADLFAASAYAQAASQDAGTDQQARDVPAEKTAPSARAGGHPPTAGPRLGLGFLGTLSGLLGTAATPSPGQGSPTLFGTIGLLALVMDGLAASKGGFRAAAGDVSRLAQFIADATEPAPASDASVPPAVPAGSAEEPRF
jgi:hypothetical protein